MTPDTQSARPGYRRPQVRRADGGIPIPRGDTSPERPARPARPARPTGPAGPAAQPAPHGRMVERAARRAREDASIARVIPLLAVIVVTVAGIYIAWLKGSAGGGEGGVVGGTALLVAAFARLVLPTRVVGLLATRKRALDVAALTILGASLLIMGLVLPR